MNGVSFEMVETLSRSELERHPVWATFEGDEHRARILRSGVAPERLDAELARFEFCGPQPLYPVLDLTEVADLPHPVLAAHLETASGRRLFGYLMPPLAFGVFVGDTDHPFNRSLPRIAAGRARALSAALGSGAEPVFPLRYEVDAPLVEGVAREGTLEAFWADP